MPIISLAPFPIRQKKEVLEKFCHGECQTILPIEEFYQFGKYCKRCTLKKAKIKYALDVFEAETHASNKRELEIKECEEILNKGYKTAIFPNIKTNLCPSSDY